MAIERKFPEEFDLKLDEHLEHINNKDYILNAVDKVNDEKTLANILNYYFRRLEITPTISENDMKEIITKIKSREIEIKTSSVNNEEFGKKLEEKKKEAPNLENISIIEPSEFDNDKKDGIRKNAVYLKFIIDGKTEIYEVVNIGAINNLVNGNSDLIQGMTEKEIMEYLKRYSKKCDVLTVDNRPANELNSEAKVEEYKKINDSRIRSIFMSEENAVLKERVDIKHYIDDYMNGEKITFALNSQGERIYLVGDKTFKFVGDDERILKEVKTDGKEEDNVQTADFNKNKKYGGKVIETNASDYVNLNDYLSVENELAYIIEGIEKDLSVSDNQIEFLCNFLRLGVDCEKTDELSFPGERLESLYYRYINLIGSHPKYSNSRIEEIMRLREGKELNEESTLRNTNIKRLQYKPKIDELSNLEKAGFISVTIILEGSLVLGFILSMIALVKRG